ncbi:MAG: permease-like cell division protein FtsX [Patescibacteria group bacterium]
MLVKPIRIIRFAFQNFWRNLWLSTVTITVMTLAFLSVNFFLLANVFFDTALDAIEARVNLTIFFKPTAQDSDIQALAARLQAMPNVSGVTYVTKDQALDQLKNKFSQQGNTLIQDTLKELDTNPLSGNLVIQAGDVSNYAAIQEVLKADEYATFIENQTMDDRQALIEKIKSVKDNIVRAGIAVNAFFAFVVILIIFNTIRMTIYTRKREIGIMKLVGATNWFIRAPLIVESLLYSVISIALTIVILYPILGASQPYVSKFFDGQALDVIGYFSNNFTTIFGTELLAAFILSVMSSSIAIGRYLKV